MPVSPQASTIQTFSIQLAIGLFIVPQINLYKKAFNLSTKGFDF